MVLCLHGLEIYTGPGGGLYNGATINHFSFNWPPINVLDTWVSKGNKSPINDYINGDFPNSPMNIEDFDFINIFMGDEE